MVWEGPNGAIFSPQLRFKPFNANLASCETEYFYESLVHPRGGATDIKMVRQSRGAAGAEASAY